MKISFGSKPYIFIKGAQPPAIYTPRRGITVRWVPVVTGIHDPVYHDFGGVYIIAQSRRAGWIGRMRKIAQEIKATAHFQVRAGQIAAERRGVWQYEGD